jgi:hypothetical protein
LPVLAVEDVDQRVHRPAGDRERDEAEHDRDRKLAELGEEHVLGGAEDGQLHGPQGRDADEDQAEREPDEPLMASALRTSN